MEIQQTTQRLNWYTQLINRFNLLIKELNIKESSAEKIKEFLTTIAREQYMTGNKNGIRWARMNPPQNNI